MQDYETLDLGPHCNAGAGLYGAEAQPPTGRVAFHGLPFLIGGERPDPSRCLVDLGAAASPVVVPVGRAARHVLFAHALLDSRLLQNGPVGEAVASYVFRYADGEELRVPVRERFEIGAIPMWWSAHPFLAVPDSKDSLAPRYEGRFGASGTRQSEVRQGWPRHFYLWDWANPRPEEPLESIALEGAGRRVVVAAITLGHLDEQPLRRVPKREVKITLPRPQDAARPFDLAVEVDRGVAAFPFPLPARPAEEFLADPFRGFGEDQNEASSPAYTEVAAIPSATVTLKSGAETLAAVRWDELERQGAVETPRARLEIVDRGRNWVRVSVLDDATGQKVPCRIHFRSPEGIPYQPHGHHNHVNSNLGTWHVDVGGDARVGRAGVAAQRLVVGADRGHQQVQEVLVGQQPRVGAAQVDHVGQHVGVGAGQRCALPHRRGRLTGRGPQRAHRHPGAFGRPGELEGHHRTHAVPEQVQRPEPAPRPGGEQVLGQFGDAGRGRVAQPLGALRVLHDVGVDTAGGQRPGQRAVGRGGAAGVREQHHHALPGAGEVLDPAGELQVRGGHDTDAGSRAEATSPGGMASTSR